MDDAYEIAKKAVTTNLGGLLKNKYGPRSIEVLPAVLRHEHIDLDELVRKAIDSGVQNQLLYVMQVWQTLANENGDAIRIEEQIGALQKAKQKKFQWLGGMPDLPGYEHICRDSTTDLMRKCAVFGKYPIEAFREQYKVYRNGRKTKRVLKSA